LKHHGEIGIAAKSNLSMPAITFSHAQHTDDPWRTILRHALPQTRSQFIDGPQGAAHREKCHSRGEAVHVTQSAMSGILARLRDYFGDPLIVSSGPQMELTSLAESLVEPVNDVLLRIDATIATRPEFDPLITRRHFSVVASDYSISVLLLDVLRRVHRDAPGMSLEFRNPARAPPPNSKRVRSISSSIRKARIHLCNPARSCSKIPM